MGNLIQVKLKLRNNDIARSMKHLADISPHVGSYIVNKACFQIARKAEIAMPVVTAAVISAEMNATGFARNAAAKSRGAWIKAGELRHLTTSERIVVASIHPNSNYNRKTGNVFQRTPPIFSSPSPGGGGRLTGRRGYKLGAQNRLRFWSWVEENAQRMIAARRKSGGFYQLGAKVVKFIFHRNYVPFQGAPVEGRDQVGGGSGSVSKAIGRVAGGTPATGNSDFARAKFWVTVTEPDSKGANTAMSRVLQPIWQAAVDAEAQSIHDYAEELYAKAIAKQGIPVSR